ncbi:MAG: threonine--tRNA ligase [Helicobacter sp.]|nr:threonine--tRNA ligase [Helicobacter sp.]
MTGDFLLIGVKIGDEILDLEMLKERGIDPDGDADKTQKIYFDNSDIALGLIRHSCAHLMAQAIKELYPSAKFFVGPVVDEGFYYDFKTKEQITNESLELISKRMKEIAKRKLQITKTTISKEEARAKFKDDELKQAVMDRIEGNDFGVYAQGDFFDLCRGPHVPHTGLLEHFKLTKLAGAYLGGDESKEMLTRIYGIAFATKDALSAYLTQLEEAKKRDHRKLANELKIFTFDEDIGSGLPIWLPRGGRLRRRLEEILARALLVNDYEPVRGPELLKSAVWKKSGHYDNYRENMYFTQIDEVDYGLKPMNCIGHIKVYESSLRSYRDLPLRFYEYGLVHRHEKSGVLHGLLRVREFTQDDAHIFCAPHQIQQEVSNILAFTHKIMSIFNFKYEMELSTRPDKSIGSDEVWDVATEALKNALQKNEINYQVDEGGGAFYGPKIDIKITDAIGRKWQCGTIQIDMNLPERFNLSYINEANQKEQPVMIHRAILGSFERFIAILLEHFGGNLPFFIAPTQVMLVPISNDEIDFCKDLRAKLSAINIYSEILDKNESLGKKVRSAEKDKVPLILVVGKKEVQSGVLSVRDRSGEFNKDGHFEIKIQEFLTLMEKSMKKASFE